MSHEPSRVHASRPDAPEGLSEVVAKGLAKAPGDRYQTAEQFADELRRVRGSSAEEASSLVAGMAAHDFNDPEMASSLEIDDLSSLDHKWREYSVPTKPPAPPSVSPLDSVTIPSLSDAPTKTATATTQTANTQTGAPSRRRNIVLAAGAGAVGMVAIAVAAFAFSRPADRTPPPVLFVEGSVAAIGVETRPVSTAGALPTSSSAKPEIPAEPVPTDALPAPTGATAAAGPSSSAKVRPANLTRAFARQEPQIARCFSDHSGDVGSKQEISVRFEIGTDGHVISTQVQPSQLAATGFGRCIARVAQATDFGPQAKPLSFRIPITAREGR
jgi:hypothetical protein